MPSVSFCTHTYIHTPHLTHTHMDTLHLSHTPTHTHAIPHTHTANGVLQWQQWAPHRRPDQNLMEKYSLLTPNQKSHSADWLYFSQVVTKSLATESYLLSFGLQHLSDCIKLCSKTCTQSTLSTASEPNPCPPQRLNVSLSSSPKCGFSYSRFSLVWKGDVVVNQVMWLQVQETLTTRTQTRCWLCRIHWPCKFLA